MAEGVFQTDRLIFLNQIWKHPAKFRLFFYIYGNAVFLKDGIDIGGIHVSRGQFLRSYRNLIDDLEYFENNSIKRYSLSRIKLLIDELVEEERIKIEVTGLGTLFTVLNYEEYQGFERFENASFERRLNGERTEIERRLNNNNKDNKDKNDINNPPIVPPLENEPENNPQCESLFVETAKGTGTPVDHSTTIEERFNRFWEVYPRKVGKGKAEEKFKKIKPSETLLQEMIIAIKTQMKSRDWIKEDGEYIPNPATWLNQKRWKDSLGTDNPRPPDKPPDNPGKYDDVYL